MSEDGEFCRRKGRWLNQKVMELYVQEAAALLYLKRIPAFIRQKVLAVFWPEVLSWKPQKFQKKYGIGSTAKQTFGGDGKHGFSRRCGPQPVTHLGYGEKRALEPLYIYTYAHLF